MKTCRRTMTVAAMVLGGAAIILGGCQAQRQTRTPDLGLEDPSVRLAQAHRLALDGQQAQKAGDRERAMNLYQDSLEHSQELHAVWNNMGTLLMEEQNYIDAVEMFRIAADLAPYDPQPHYNIGRVYDEAGYPQRAMEFYERSLERDPRFILSLRGYILAAKRLDLAGQPMLQRVRTALLVERDPQWREFHQREQIRIEAALRDDRTNGRPRAASW